VAVSIQLHEAVNVYSYKDEKLIKKQTYAKTETLWTLF